jgi:hypothetical protein
MVRIVNQSLATTRREDLTAEQRERALRRLARQTQRNPLRRVRLACCELSVRDAVAQLGDHVWCETHADFARVVDVVE